VKNGEQSSQEEEEEQNTSMYTEFFQLALSSVTRTVVFFIMFSNQAIICLFPSDEMYLNILGLFNEVVSISEGGVRLQDNQCIQCWKRRHIHLI
jgi:ABC-type uncharacterized transport system involved in gliding motility auxiliary subunit